MNSPPDMPASDHPEDTHPHTKSISDLRFSIPGELAAAISHELNQPLAAILGNAQAARRFIAADKIDRDELLAILEDIIRDTKRAAGIIHSLRQSSH